MQCINDSFGSDTLGKSSWGSIFYVEASPLLLNRSWRLEHLQMKTSSLGG
ncbi:unnamed protein product, partial [Linum tenue]